MLPRPDLGGDGPSPGDYWLGKVPNQPPPPSGGLHSNPVSNMSPSPAPFLPWISAGPGDAPAPRPLSPMAATGPVGAAPSGPPPAPAPFVPATIPASVTNPATGQSSPAVGTPSGYSNSTGINTSTQSLLPTDFNLGSLTGGSLPDAAAPSAGSVASQGASLQQAPTQWNVTPDQTVQGQYAGLMAKGNPAIAAAEAAVTRKYAASGGANDLMAAGAAGLAGSQVALQIASQDAQTHAQAGQFNAAAANTFKQQLNAFTDNAVLSSQNFQQGVAMLKDQSNQQIQQMYAQVEANAATQSTNLKATLATIQGQTNATLEQMDKQFSQNVASMGVQEQYNQRNASQSEAYTNQNAWTQYGMQVRMGYLNAVNTQQQSLMQTMGEIRANPNITAAQASAATTDAINQFNAFMTMNNAYFASMIPASPAANYTAYNASTWPNP